MCTVTYLPLGNNNFILTSNRDENPKRKTIPPKKYNENGVELLYPKDKLAGGTWVGLSKKNRLVCLLNGGFTKHKRKKDYRVSRGVVVKQILIADNAVAFIKEYNFYNIEPFTLVLVDWNTSLETFELVWDGDSKHFSKLKQEPKIWSSSTLYTDQMKQMRKNWFKDWLAKNKEFHQKKIVDFHQNETLGTKETALKMKRTFVETVSVTSFKKEKEKIDFMYLDFIAN